MVHNMEMKNEGFDNLVKQMQEIQFKYTIQSDPLSRDVSLAFDMFIRNLKKLQMNNTNDEYNVELHFG